ncbi:MAG: S-methyl-5-thioribose-1-phosphate isomerase [Leptospira sp.]|nr:S-methyl-5-thioribose-1-phosphate isomerase [Leptospira sp.]
MNQSNQLKPIIWKNDQLDLLDQRLIPSQKKYIQCNNLEDVIDAIRSMATRGAPAIAISGAFGLVLELKKIHSLQQAKPSYEKFLSLCNDLQDSRPTAVNLSRMIKDLLRNLDSKLWEEKEFSEIISLAETFAVGEFNRDITANQAIGQNALSLFPANKKELHIITHCNTGALATAGHGTALGIIRTLKQNGYSVHVYADETRPYLQGSRLTAFEMKEEGIDCHIITDSMSAWLMNDRKIDAVIVGCDRIAKNGDTANKIGTRGLAIIAKEHNVPFYVAGTKDSFDINIETGKEIPIEMREESEVTSFSFLKDENGLPYLKEGIIAPVGIPALNPSFDITPAKFITKIITEIGVWNPGEQKID